MEIMRRDHDKALAKLKKVLKPPWHVTPRQQKLLFGVLLLMLATLFVGMSGLFFGVRELKNSKVLIVSLSVGSGKDDYQQALRQIPLPAAIDAPTAPQQTAARAP